ncbi:MAG: FAD-dependent oxidoreductase [Alphaproteobacteria bacterium]
MKKLVIVGGDFAGLWAAMAAAREIDLAGREIDRAGQGVEITLVSRDPFLTLRPRLYERDPESLRTPLAPVLEPLGIELTLGTVTAIDHQSHRIETAEAVFDYDRLILAAGSVRHAPPIPGLKEHAWNIDDYPSAVALDRHLAASVAIKTVVIIGGGFTGLELACEMRSRIAVHGGAAVASAARMMLIEKADVVGPTLGVNPRPAIEAALSTAGVEVRLATRVMRIERDAVMLSDGENIATETAIVTVGQRANPLCETLPAPRDALGRLMVDAELRVEDISDIYATGDVAHARTDDENVALMSCQHALTMGKVAGYNAARDLLGLELTPYRQERYVTCLDLGPWGAVYTEGWDRQITMTPTEAKTRKREINRRSIYPPQGDRAALLAASVLD